MNWNRRLFVVKIKALLAHVSISLVLVGMALALMLLQWFPPPLFTTDGGGIGLKLLVLVDLILGPVLTFVVFDPNKKRSKMVFDLSVIALFQLGAYGYGLWNIHAVRVQALSFHEGQFHAVTAATFAEQTIADGGWQPLGEGPVRVVNTREPKDGDEASGVVGFQLVSGMEPYELHFLYEPFAPTVASHWSQGHTLAAMRGAQPALADTAQRWLDRKGLSAEAVRFYRVTGFYNNAVVAIADDGRWLGGFEGELPKLTSSASPKS